MTYAKTPITILQSKNPVQLGEIIFTATPTKIIENKKGPLKAHSMKGRRFSKNAGVFSCFIGLIFFSLLHS
jgi:hypothetical protein